MKFETYYIYIRALVYHMNYLESRKSIEQAAKAMSALTIQPSPENSAADNSARLLSSNNYHLSTQLPLMVDPEEPVNLTDDFQDLNLYPLPTKCHNCNSTHIEFDNSISRAICMGCGGELDNNLGAILDNSNPLQLVESM